MDQLYVELNKLEHIKSIPITNWMQHSINWLLTSEFHDTILSKGSRDFSTDDFYSASQQIKKSSKELIITLEDENEAEKFDVINIFLGLIGDITAIPLSTYEETYKPNNIYIFQNNNRTCWYHCEIRGNHSDDQTTWWLTYPILTNKLCNKKVTITYLSGGQIFSTNSIDDFYDNFPQPLTFMQKKIIVNDLVIIVPLVKELCGMVADYLNGSFLYLPNGQDTDETRTDKYFNDIIAKLKETKNNLLKQIRIKNKIEPEEEIIEIQESNEKILSWEDFE